MAEAPDGQRPDDTDSHDYRKMLKLKQGLLERVIGQLNIG